MHTETRIHADACLHIRTHRALRRPRSVLPHPAGIVATLSASPLPGCEQGRISGLRTWVLSKTLLFLAKWLPSQSLDVLIHKMGARVPASQCGVPGSGALQGGGGKRSQVSPSSALILT